MRYKNIVTGEIWEESEIRESFEQFKYEMEGWEEKTFDEYMDYLLDLGKQKTGGIVEVK